MAHAFPGGDALGALCGEPRWPGMEAAGSKLHRCEKCSDQLERFIQRHQPGCACRLCDRYRKALHRLAELECQCNGEVCTPCLAQREILALSER